MRKKLKTSYIAVTAIFFLGATSSLVVFTMGRNDVVDRFSLIFQPLPNDPAKAISRKLEYRFGDSYLSHRVQK